jgi:hypothetical protein
LADQVGRLGALRGEGEAADGEQAWRPRLVLALHGNQREGKGSRQSRRANPVPWR